MPPETLGLGVLVVAGEGRQSLGELFTDATQHLHTGQRVTVGGSAGTEHREQQLWARLRPCYEPTSLARGGASMDRQRVEWMLQRLQVRTRRL